MTWSPELPSYVEHYSSRDDWGGGDVRSGHPVPESQIVGWVQHHTAFALRDFDGDGFLRGDLDDARRYMRTLQTARPDLGGEVPYSWVIFPGSSDDTCIIAEGRGRGRTGAHTAGLNSTRYAFAIAGNTDADLPLTPGMIRGMRWLASQVIVVASPVPTIGHQQAPPYFQNGVNLNATGCPGGNGLAHLAELQPPFSAPADTAAPAPVTRRDTAVHEFTNILGLKELIDINLATGELRNWWEQSPGSAFAGPGRPVEGAFQSLGDAVYIKDPKTGKVGQVWFQAVADAFGGVLVTVIQSKDANGSVKWSSAGTNDLRKFLAGR
jgi:hypothetical protein